MSFQALLGEWIDWHNRSLLIPMIHVAKTIKQHHDSILCWFQDSRIDLIGPRLPVHVFYLI
ncbi:transposase [Paenibacillus sp. OSY-SE]|uniref:transposase n=1 Tax=Paenibacillus sp. OSY-SE TaxID=1196323 RepID=UPI0012FA64EB